MIMGSGKMVLLDRLLAQLKDEGHRVLIFSQMVLGASGKIAKTDSADVVTYSALIYYCPLVYQCPLIYYSADSSIIYYVAGHHVGRAGRLPRQQKVCSPNFQFKIISCRKVGRQVG